MSEGGALIQAKNWTPNQRKFMAWLALPSVDRVPLFQKQLAAEMGVHEVTLSKWKALPGVELEVQQLIRANLGDVLNDVIGALKDQAKRGELGHIKTYLEMIGWYVPKFAPTNPTGDKEYSGGIAFIERKVPNGRTVSNPDEVLGE